jgi:hypothetical protein
MHVHPLMEPVGYHFGGNPTATMLEVVTSDAAIGYETTRVPRSLPGGVIPSQAIQMINGQRVHPCHILHSLHDYLTWCLMALVFV